MYRAVNDQTYNSGLDNTNAGNLAGVLWYLHQTVVWTCPRFNQITKIVRYEVEVKNTQVNYDQGGSRQSQFGHFEAFIDGVVQGHDESLSRFKQYGYTAGCQNVIANYTNSIWYSLPGHCPNNTDKNAVNCSKDYPGGMCGPEKKGKDSLPNGNKTCTWKAKYVDEISVNQISGIPNNDLQGFCNGGGVEYDPKTDKGRNGVSFWNDRQNKSRNLDRVRRVAKMFLDQNPNTTLHPLYPTPLCDGW